MASRALLKAVSLGRLKQTRLLIDSGASTEYADECGQTALNKAVFLEDIKCREKMIRLLLSKNANCDHLDAVGRTILSWACMLGREPEVSMILQCGELDMNSADICGQTALYHSVTSGNAAVVKKIVMALKKYDLSVDLEDNNGVSPLMHAIRLGHDICASILTLQGGAKVGLGMMFPEDFFSAQKWATKNLHDRGRIVPKKSQFPPIPVNKAFVTMQYVSPVSILSLQTINETPNIFSIYSDDSNSVQTEDNYSSDDFEEYPYTTTPFINYLPNTSISHSILAGTPEGSNLTTSRTADKDDYSTVVEDGKTKLSQEVSQMFGIVQDQMSSSFRESAKHIPEVFSSMNTFISSSQTSLVSTVTKEKKRKSLIGEKWNQQKQDLLLINDEVCDMSSDDNSSTENKDFCESTYKVNTTCFPILSNKNNLVQANNQFKSTNNNMSYSYM